MQRLSKETIEGRVEFWTEELCEAPQDAICRLRHCFPDLAETDLLRMAKRHPETARLIRYCRQRVARYRRMLRGRK